MSPDTFLNLFSTKACDLILSLTTQFSWLTLYRCFAKISETVCWLDYQPRNSTKIQHSPTLNRKKTISWIILPKKNLMFSRPGGGPLFSYRFIGCRRHLPPVLQDSDSASELTTYRDFQRHVTLPVPEIQLRLGWIDHTIHWVFGHGYFS